MRAGIIGLGKMGISHYAIVNLHPEVELVAVCDTNTLVLDVLRKYTNVKTYSDFSRMIQEGHLDCVFISTPTKYHGKMIRFAFEHGLHVFCEKPFCLDLKEGEELIALARQKDRVNQVGYHYRFVASFIEAKRILDGGALGKIHSISAEAYGAVVLRSKGATWRAVKGEGGGCLLDYASHAIDLVHYLVGTPERVRGAVLGKVFSKDVEDEVYAVLDIPGGITCQLAANWSDESFRKMSTTISIWGTNGRMNVDRQECQVYLRTKAPGIPEIDEGWCIRYTTDLTKPVWYYLRGEEYSAQIDYFIQCILDNNHHNNVNSFASAYITDQVTHMIAQASTEH